MSRSGSSSMRLSSRVASRSLVSWGEALAVPMARGRPAPSAAAMTFVLLPRFVCRRRAPLFRRGEVRVDEARLQVEASTHLQVQGQGAQDGAESTVPHPALEPAVDRLVGRVLLPRQLAPLRPGFAECTGFRPTALVRGWAFAQTGPPASTSAREEAAQSDSTVHKSGLPVSFEHGHPFHVD